MKPTRRGILYITAGFIALAPLLIWFLSRIPTPRQGVAVVPVAVARVVTPTGANQPPLPLAGDKEALRGLAKRDPLALARRGYERYKQDIQDYRCMLLKQEFICGKLAPAEEVAVRFRKSPLSIYMLWQGNPSQATRALYMDDPAYMDEEGHKLARVEPAGAIVRLFVRDLFLPIEGDHARKASRRTIAECGFGSTFELLERFNTQARKKGVLDIHFGGMGEVDGRPTYVIVRYLPYSGEGGPYPDAKMVLHLDQEWLLPVAVESFSDRAGTKLLGRYVFTEIELNPGLSDQDFEF